MSLRHRRTPAGVLVGVLLVSLLMTAGVASSASNCFGKASTVSGATAGDNTLTGTPGPDVIVGLGGNDTINGLGGADRICGGAGDDTINGGGGNDSLRGEDGNDLVVGGPGADRILGDGGDDTLQGQGGDDDLNGGGGADNASGGVGADTCVAETRSGCEVVPPTGCTNPVREPAVVTATNVAVLGSNAFTRHSSVGICTGGVCDYDYLDFRAEVRNNTAGPIELGEAEIAVYDGSGRRVATRYAYFWADVLAPGERTVMTETLPSMLYTSGETNHYPHGWASWELVIQATSGTAGDYDDVVIRSGLSSVTRDADGDLAARGVAINSLGREIDDVSWWVVLYDANGRLINVGTEADYSVALAPGERADMEVTIYSWYPTCFGSVAWGASGK